MPTLTQSAHGYNLITSDNRLYFLFETSSGFSSQFKGKVNENYKPSGKLLKKIPNRLKPMFFKLQKNEQELL
jgi:hypothetical protein